MDMSNFRPELHVAQQSRRDKLRIQHDNSNPQPHYHNFSVYANNLGQLHAQDGLNYNNIRTCRPVNGNICYDPSELSSEMLHFSANSQGMLSNQEPEKRVVGLDCSYDENNFSRTIPNNPNSATAVSSDPQYFSSTWKSIGSQSISCDWLANQSPIFVGEGLSASHHQLKIMNNNNNSSANLDVKPNYHGYHQELHETPNNSYQNALQELVTSSNVRSLGLEFASLRQKGSEENSHGGPNWFQWSGELDYAAARNNNNNNNTNNSDRDLRVNDSFSNTQALSLSLSSVPSPKMHATQIAAEKDSNCTDLTDIQEYGKMMGNQASTHRNPGPLGPFTGYATILRSSKFLRPAQQLMDDLCCTARPKNGEVCEVNDKNLGEVIRVCDQGVCNGDFGVKGVGSDVSGGSSFAFSGSCDKIRETGGTSYSTDLYRPENLQKKARLIFMQDEVCKKYKQYQQQMQMVVSSFESVSGLSAATPYVSLALKMVSKHFRCLKNAIIEQMKSIRNALGEDLSSSNNSKGEASVSMLKFFDQSFQKQKGGGAGFGSLEGHHIWRPQRGLPEHAVSVLRAWLFDHFLHPYPTDTDKHMLAAQTGLTRNQVSNWFINARVRVWKPMVEEIHMLETKGGVIPEGGSGSENASAKTNNGKTTIETCNQSNHDSNTQSLNKPVECSTISPSSEQDFERPNANMWNQEKRSRVEYHGQSGIDRSLMGWVPPHHRGGSEMGPTGGGLDAVSLTLGLMQSVENAQQEQHHHLRTHFGGRIIRDFVG